MISEDVFLALEGAGTLLCSVQTVENSQPRRTTKLVHFIPYSPFTAGIDDDPLDSQHCQ